MLGLHLEVVLSVGQIENPAILYEYEFMHCVQCCKIVF